jgi:hypothetical protein
MAKPEPTSRQLICRRLFDINMATPKIQSTPRIPTHLDKSVGSMVIIPSGISR